MVWHWTPRKTIGWFRAQILFFEKKLNELVSLTNKTLVLRSSCKLNWFQFPVPICFQACGTFQRWSFLMWVIISWTPNLDDLILRTSYRSWLPGDFMISHGGKPWTIVIELYIYTIKWDIWWDFMEELEECTLW